MLFRPLINSLFDVIPVVWDAYSNAVYRLVTGVKFEDKIEVEDIEINNEVLYEYVPLFEEDKTNFKKFKLDSKIVYEYIEGNKEGLRACVGVDVKALCSVPEHEAYSFLCADVASVFIDVAELFIGKLLSGV